MLFFLLFITVDNGNYLWLCAEWDDVSHVCVIFVFVCAGVCVRLCVYAYMYVPM